MPRLHHELGSSFTREKRLSTGQARSFGKKVVESLAWGPEVTPDMLDPWTSDFPRLSKIHGIPVDQVAADPTILLRGDERDHVYRLYARGAGDRSPDNK